MAVTNDKLALATANRNERINRFQAGGHRLMHRFPWDNAGGFNVSNRALFGFQRAFAINWVTEAVNHTAEKLVTCWNVHNRVRPLNGVALFNVTVRTKNNDTNIVGLEVQRHSTDTTGEFNHFAGLNIVQPIHTRNTVTN